MRYLALALLAAACGAPSAIPPTPCDPACAAGQSCIAGRCFVEVDASTQDAAQPDVTLDAAPSDVGSDAVASDSGPDAVAVEAAVDAPADAARDAVMMTCPVGQTICDGACADTQVAYSNCGACGNRCRMGSATLHTADSRCVMGMCEVMRCETGFADCDRNGTTCETALNRSGNCGACGMICAAGTSCIPVGAGAYGCR